MGLVASALAVAASHGTALAAGNEGVCVSAYERSQQLRREGKLHAALEQATVCAQPSCPVVAQRDCARWFDEVERAMPTLIVDARGADGKDLTLVRVTLDGKLIAERLDGKPVQLDPGEHRFRFEGPRGQVIEETVVAREGEKERRLTVDLSGPKPPPPREVTRGIPTATWVLGGVAVVGLASWAFWGLRGLAAFREYSDACAQGRADVCNHDVYQRDAMNYHLGTASLGVALLAGAGAAYLALRTPSARVGVAATATSLGFVVLH
jgi:hypothetical protein